MKYLVCFILMLIVLWVNVAQAQCTRNGCGQTTTTVIVDKTVVPPVVAVPPAGSVKIEIKEGRRQPVRGVLKRVAVHVRHPLGRLRD